MKKRINERLISFDSIKPLASVFAFLLLALACIVVHIHFLLLAGGSRVRPSHQIVGLYSLSLCRFRCTELAGLQHTFFVFEIGSLLLLLLDVFRNNLLLYIFAILRFESFVGECAYVLILKI